MNTGEAGELVKYRDCKYNKKSIRTSRFYLREGMMEMSLLELEQKGLELKSLEKDIKELGDSL
ncbi:MAG: hypothetical protein GX022_05175 [Clostridiaceae bacterium]|nr:hypothetical protein [Clostridiaceae bacterium]